MQFELFRSIFEVSLWQLICFSKIKKFETAFLAITPEIDKYPLSISVSLHRRIGTEMYHLCQSKQTNRKSRKLMLANAQDITGSSMRTVDL